MFAVKCGDSIEVKIVSNPHNGVFIPSSHVTGKLLGPGAESLRFPFALLSFTGSGPFNRCLVAKPVEGKCHRQIGQSLDIILNVRYSWLIITPVCVFYFISSSIMVESHQIQSDPFCQMIAVC